MTLEWDAVLCCCLANFCVLCPSFLSLQFLSEYALSSIWQDYACIKL